MVGQSSINIHLVDCGNYRNTNNRRRPFTIINRQVEGKNLAERMKEKYGTFRDAPRLDVVIINDDIVRFATLVLDCKLPRKFWKHQVPTGAITTTEKCVARVMMNWSKKFVK
jgi:hypothetical protein